MEQLQRAGYPAFLTMKNGLYAVQVGAFLQLDNAVRMENSLREAGYQTYITT
ncbi:MAG: SPOR domain-containing protein [Eubacteriales bacterium]|nr:SPOR domain-containing protein [Eubacteriales bacterium]